MPMMKIFGPFAKNAKLKAMQTFHILWYNESVIHTDNFEMFICSIFLFEIKRV